MSISVTEMGVGLDIGLTSCPTVLLEHDLPDETHHFDWLIARDPKGVQPLMCFRISARLDQLKPGDSLDAVQIDDHRGAYLEYEGPVSGDRGVVRRLCQGDLARLPAETPPLAAGDRVIIQWHSGPAPNRNSLRQ